MKEKRLPGQDMAWPILKYMLSFAAVMVIGSVLIVYQGENPLTAIGEAVKYSVSMGMKPSR